MGAGQEGHSEGAMRVETSEARRAASSLGLARRGRAQRDHLTSMRRNRDAASTLLYLLYEYSVLIVYQRSY